MILTSSYWFNPDWALWETYIEETWSNIHCNIIPFSKQNPCEQYEESYQTDSIWNKSHETTSPVISSLSLFQQCCVFGNQNGNNVLTWPTLDIWSTHKTTVLRLPQASHMSLWHNDQFPGPLASAWEATWRCPYAEPSNLIYTTRAQKKKKTRCVTVCHHRETILLENKEHTMK